MRHIAAIKWFLPLLVIFLVAGCGISSNDSKPAGVEETQPPTAAAADGKIEVTLYAMSECPFGVPAEKVVHKVSQTLPDALDLRLIFIVGQGPDGKLNSLHGPGELQKNIVQACVGKTALAKQYEFVFRWNESGKDWQEVAKELELDASAIELCAANEGESIMREHLAETEKNQVNASPTILINGQRYGGGINSLELFGAICQASGDKRPAACANPPDTLSRSDGSGAGSCNRPGTPPKLPDELVDKTPIEHTVVVAGNAVDQSRVEEVLNQTRALYPNVKINKVKSDSALGKKLIAKYNLRMLPAFIFPKEVKDRKNFQALQQHLLELEDGYILAPQIGSNFFLDREPEKKRLDIFFTPFSPKALRVLLDVGDLLARPDVQALGVDIHLRPFAMVQDGQIQSQMGPPEIEEMLRVLAVIEQDPAKAWDYLKARYENPMSSWWEEYVKSAGLDPDVVKKAAQSDTAAAKLAENSNLAGTLAIAEDFVVLVENRELARIVDKDSFKKLLFDLAK
ncbi:MAG: hypothetical protein P9L99_00760 [Candidatus Lernaella stagnicola]|nr:hypothetical protein [Candidatus Lernaella stagnicola]